MIWVFWSLLIGYIIGTCTGYFVGYKFGIHEAPRFKTKMIRKTPTGEAIERSCDYLSEDVNGNDLWITTNEN